MPHANAVKRQYAVSRLPDEPKSGAVSRQRIVVDERGMIDLPFLILTILLSLIGLVMMFSASYARAYMEEGNSSYYFVRQAGARQAVSDQKNCFSAHDFKEFLI